MLLSSHDLRLSGEMLLYTVVIKIIMTYTIKTTWGFQHSRAGGVLQGEEGLSSRVSISLWGERERERPITPLLHFLSQGQEPNGHINNTVYV